MSDDLREREPRRDQGDFPAEDGTRSDHAGTGAGVVGPAPGGGDPKGVGDRPAGDPEALAGGPAGGDEPPSGMGTSAGGGYGVGSDRQSSGGTGEGQAPAGDDAQTDWLRSAKGGAPSDESQG